MKPGSTVDDPEVAAMLSSGSKGPFFSGGGFSNIFPSDCHYFNTLSCDTDKVDKSGCLNTRDVLLKIIRRDI